MGSLNQVQYCKEIWQYRTWFKLPISPTEEGKVLTTEQTDALRQGVADRERVGHA
jgi:hypothetical protein